MEKCSWSDVRVRFCVISLSGILQWLDWGYKCVLFSTGEQKVETFCRIYIYIFYLLFICKPSNESTIIINIQNEGYIEYNCAFVGLFTNNKSGFVGLEVAWWPLVPKNAGSNPVEVVWFFRTKKSSARLPPKGK